jgi:hypothetical protein
LCNTFSSMSLTSEIYKSCCICVVDSSYYYRCRRVSILYLCQCFIAPKNKIESHSVLKFNLNFMSFIYGWSIVLTLNFANFMTVCLYSVALVFCNMISLFDYPEKLKNGSSNWFSYHWYLCWFGPWSSDFLPHIFRHKVVQETFSSYAIC